MGDFDHASHLFPGANRIGNFPVGGVAAQAVEHQTVTFYLKFTESSTRNEPGKGGAANPYPADPDQKIHSQLRRVNFLSVRLKISIPMREANS